MSVELKEVDVLWKCALRGDCWEGGDGYMAEASELRGCGIRMGCEICLGETGRGLGPVNSPIGALGDATVKATLASESSC